MRVLAVTNMYPTDADPAYGVFVQSQMASVARAGIDVELLVIEGRRGPLQYLKAILQITERSRASAFDLVHAHYGLSGYCASFQSLPLVVSFCGDDLLGTPDAGGGITVKSRLHQWLSRVAARRADGIICKSEGLRQALPRKRDRERAQVIPNGVDTERFCPGDRRKARQDLGIGIEERIVLFPHTITVSRKRFDLAQAAVAELAKRGVEARLLPVAGASHELMPTYYQAADCLLLTSNQEGSPNTVKEALCCDLPIVSVDVGDVAHWLGMSSGSALVSEDSKGVAEGLMKVLSGPGSVDGSAVRDVIGLTKIAERIGAVYDTVLSNRRLGGT